MTWTLAEVESPVTSMALLGTVVIVSAVAWHAVRDVVRRRRIRRVVGRFGLDTPGWAHPELPIPVLDAEMDSYAVANVTMAQNQSRMLAVFDLRVGYGRHRLIQTVVAIQGQVKAGERHLPEICAGCEIQELNGWQMIFKPGQLLDATEVEDLLELLLDAVR